MVTVGEVEKMLCGFCCTCHQSLCWCINQEQRVWWQVLCLSGPLIYVILMICLIWAVGTGRDPMP